MFQSEFLIRVLTTSRHDGGCGMSRRPGYYSGRPATVSDLNSTQLERLHTAIKANVGDEAAAAFAQMVADIPVLTATDFLLSLMRLEGNGWVWEKSMLGSENGVYVDCEGSAFGTVVARMGSRGEDDDTPSIRGPFLRALGIQVPPHEANPYDCRVWW